MNADRRSEFRQMAANPDIVERVIANSTDESPPSRRKVVEAIKAASTPRPRTPSDKDARWERIANMANEGYTSRQVAKILGVNSGSSFANELPEDDP